MVTVALCGGLGNQMFQYAAGLNLGQRLGVTPSFDTSWFDHIKGGSIGTYREMELLQFAGVNFSNGKIGQFDRLLEKVVRKVPRGLGSTIFGQRVFIDGNPFVFNEEFNTCRNRVVIFGYFQSVDYLRPIETKLRDIFIAKSQIDPLYQSIRNKVEGPDSICVHVRRGDYVTDKAAATYHGTLDKDYYLNSIRFLREKRYGGPAYFFSDDLAWCIENFARLDDVHFVDTKHLNSVQVMHLMSLCHHQVIANSSFSWWAGWLNRRPDKVVVMPEFWVKTLPTKHTGLIYKECLVIEG